MDKSKQKILKTVVVMVLFAGIVIFVYFSLMNNTESKGGSEEEVTVPTEEVDKVIAKDLGAAYPSTPREVVKLYSRFSKCFYDGDYSEEKFDKLVEQYRLLLDSDLIANNPEEDFVKSLKDEIADYEKNKRTISNYSIGNSSSVVYTTIDGDKYATLDVEYFLNEGTDYTKVYEEFMLRKDTNSKWKIVGWKTIAPTAIDDEE